MIAFALSNVAVIAVGGAMLVGLVSVLSWVVVSVIKGGNRREQQRLSVLEKALEHPQMDEAMRRQLVASLFHEQQRRMFLFRASFWRRVTLVVGWIGFVLSLGAFVGRINQVWFTPYETILPILLISIALLTLPTALRELLRREEAPLRGAEPR